MGNAHNEIPRREVRGPLKNLQEQNMRVRGLLSCNDGVEDQAHDLMRGFPAASHSSARGRPSSSRAWQGRFGAQGVHDGVLEASLGVIRRGEET